MRGKCEEQPHSQPGTNAVVFRDPFTLKLHVDKEHYYEQEFPKIPYVYQNDVYLMKGDSFGIDLQITNGVIGAISYQPDTNKASVTLRFTQEIENDGDAMMMLVIKNQTDLKLYTDALITVPGRKKPGKTSILPVGPHLVGYESWPHPIVQLVLRNIRLQEKSGTAPEGAGKGTQPIPSDANRTSSPTGSPR